MISITENISKQVDSEDCNDSYSSGLLKVQSDRVLVASVDSKGPLEPLDIQERQELKVYEDQLIDIILVLDLTLDTISSLKEKYQEFCREVEPSPVYQASVNAINSALEEKQREVLLNRKKVEALQTKIQGTMSLVRVRNNIYV